jgi:hypothetical protein
MAGREPHATRRIPFLLGLIAFAALLSYATLTRWRDLEAVRAEIALFRGWATTRATGGLATPIGSSTAEKQGWIGAESECRYEFQARTGERFILAARARSGAGRELESVTLIVEGRSIGVPVEAVYEGRPIDLMRMLPR